MSAVTIALIVFVCVFGGAMLGSFIRHFLPERHLDNESKDTVKLAMGLIATLSALVLGLMVSTAKGSFDRINNELTQHAAIVVQLDRVLAQYGPETKEVRQLIKSNYTTAIGQALSGDEAQLRALNSPERVAQAEAIPAQIMALTPRNEAQRTLQARSMQLTEQLSGLRWLVIVQLSGGVPKTLLVILVSWLSIIFAGWGLFAPRNPAVTAALLASALCVSGAIFLMLELDRPLTGHIKISSAPMYQAISLLGQ